MANDAVKKSDLYWYDNTHKIKHSINKELVERLSSGNNRFSSMESRGTTENLETNEKKRPESNSDISEEEKGKLKNLKVLVLTALRIEKHISHFSL